MSAMQTETAMSQDDLAVIETALQTQAKILDVQAAAGGEDALARLNEVKRVLAQIALQRSPEPSGCAGAGLAWAGVTRLFRWA